MVLLFFLLILLAIAWGVADFQLQSRIDVPPPPRPAPKSAPAAPTPPKAEPPAADAPAGNAEPAPDSERAVTAQETRPAAPVPERTPD